MSHVETFEAQGSAWSYSLIGLAFVLLVVGTSWFALHGGPYLLTVWRRGRAYRARLRAARHRRPLLVRSTVR